MPRAEYLALLKQETSKTLYNARLNAYEKGDLVPTNYTLIIEYEAPNAYGTPVRSFSTCEYFDGSGSLEYVTKNSVKIDGKTSTDLLVDQARSLYSK